MKPIALAVHGGAGAIRREELSSEREAACHAGLRTALMKGWNILQEGGTALDAVEAVVRVMEDDIHFNAGRGAAFSHDGHQEMDASIMDGRTLDAGSVAGVRNVRNPITLARRIMERSPHVFLGGTGAAEFAREMGLEFADDEYFFDEYRYSQLLEARERQRVQLDHSHSTGTVGAVALDRQGDLAAATSTGGMTNKRYGRIGDSPVIGAGTYANNSTCAVSCTGHGEYILRGVSAYDLSCLMEYAGLDLRTAGQRVIDKLGELGGVGGLIAIDRHGEIILPFNSDGMYRAWIGEESDAASEIFRVG